ncbi:MAG: ethanolamine utilization protein EutN [Anaerolineaceae bacterium]|nr:ethanolamine utilization protein EutN [Anaerolineaceae bacterium]
MVIGIVTGSVVASQKTANMDGLALRVVRRITPEGELSDSYVVAVDALGAATNEYVIVASGSTARQTTATDNKPIDAIIMAIIDTWQIGNRIIYDKSSQSIATG